MQNRDHNPYASPPREQAVIDWDARAYNETAACIRAACILILAAVVGLPWTIGTGIDLVFIAYDRYRESWPTEMQLDVIKRTFWAFANGALLIYLTFRYVQQQIEAVR